MIVETVWMNNTPYAIESIITGGISLKGKNPFEKKVLEIIRKWNTGKTEFEFYTSGTTGTPKRITITREQMIKSAKSTLKFLKINGGTCLLCLNPEFIAGTMVIIRALVGNMQLIAINPTSNPLKNLSRDLTIDFCSMVPLQVHETLKNPISKERFQRIAIVLIGGADVSTELLFQLRNLSNSVYHTFGLTETVTHIALKKVSGNQPELEYVSIPGVTISQDERGCLVIKGKLTNNKPVITNDLIKITGRHKFEWLGRVDHLINSGGIKVIIEQLEQKIDAILYTNRIILPFIIVGIPDVKFGEKIAIIWETPHQDLDIEEIKILLKKELEKFEFPREWRIIPALIKTSSNKINRKKTLELSIPLA